MNEATPTPDASTGDAPSWIDRHRDCWRRKPALRWYYETQIFDRIIRRMNPGETLELGSGPGFFASYRPGMVSSDITPTGSHVVEADAHDLPFVDGRFSNVVGVDVLHHLARPGRALRECARVLQDGGRIILVEPWPSTFGWFFYRYIHHDDSRRVAAPWQRPFA